MKKKILLLLNFQAIYVTVYGAAFLLVVKLSVYDKESICNSLINAWI